MHSTAGIDRLNDARKHLARLIWNVKCDQACFKVVRRNNNSRFLKKIGRQRDRRTERQVDDERPTDYSNQTEKK